MPNRTEWLMRPVSACLERRCGGVRVRVCPDTEVSRYAIAAWGQPHLGFRQRELPAAFPSEFPAARVHDDVHRPDLPRLRETRCARMVVRLEHEASLHDEDEADQTFTRHEMNVGLVAVLHAAAGRNDGDHGRPVRRKHRLAANLNPVGPAAAGVRMGEGDRYATLGTLTLVKIAKALRCSVDLLLAGTDPDYDCMPKRGGADEIPVIAEGAPPRPCDGTSDGRQPPISCSGYPVPEICKIWTPTPNRSASAFCVCSPASKRNRLMFSPRDMTRHQLWRSGFHGPERSDHRAGWRFHHRSV